MSLRIVPDPEPTSENPLWDDLCVSLIRAQTGPAAPTLATFRDGLRLYSFSKTTDQELLFDMQLPHTWQAGTDIRPHVHWSPGSSTDTGTVRWALEYTWANAVNTPGNVFTTSSTITVEQAASGTAYAHQIASFPAITGTGFRLSSILICRLFRDADHANDTFDAVAFGVSFDTHIRNQTGGSVAEFSGA